MSFVVEMNPAKQVMNRNCKGSLLKEVDADSDSDLPEFSLPPKSVVKRPRKTVKKRTRSQWRKACRNFCRYCSGVVLVLVLTACVLSIALLFWFSLRLYRDVENLSRRLTIEINRVQAEQVDNVEKCDAFAQDMKKSVQKIHSAQKDIDNIKQKLDVSFLKIAVLNGTLHKMSRHLHDPRSKLTVTAKVNALQKGMASTGAEITKLGDEVNKIEKLSMSQSTVIRKILSGLSNVSLGLANVTGKSDAIFHPGSYFLAPVSKDKNSGTVESANLPQASFLLPERVRVMEMVKAVNHSLLSKVNELQSETARLKMKLINLGDSHHNFDLHSEDRANLSNVVVRVQRDVSSVQSLLRKLNYRIHNLTQFAMKLTGLEKKLASKVNGNIYEIKMLWNELELHNHTLLTFQNNMDKAHESEISPRKDPPDEAETTKNTNTSDDFHMFSEPYDHSLSDEKRRDVFEAKPESKLVDYKPISDNADTYGDLMKIH